MAAAIRILDVLAFLTLSFRLFAALNRIAIGAKNLPAAGFRVKKYFHQIGVAVNFLLISSIAKSATMFSAVVGDMINLKRALISESTTTALVSQRFENFTAKITALSVRIFADRDTFYGLAVAIFSSYLFSIFQIVKPICIGIFLAVALVISNTLAWSHRRLATIVTALLADSASHFEHAPASAVRMTKEILRTRLLASTTEPHRFQSVAMGFVI